MFAVQLPQLDLLRVGQRTTMVGYGPGVAGRKMSTVSSTPSRQVTLVVSGSAGSYSGLNREDSYWLVMLLRYRVMKSSASLMNTPYIYVCLESVLPGLTWPAS